jgi:hypothetical protein
MKGIDSAKGTSGIVFVFGCSQLTLILTCKQAYELLHHDLYHGYLDLHDLPDLPDLPFLAVR